MKWSELSTLRSTTASSVMAIVLAFASLAFAVPAEADELHELRILYVGSERTDDFVGFLQGHFRVVESADRATFQPADAEKFDVVLLDWPQSAEARLERTKKTSPLGKREDWTRPTVLLGSAGLNLAAAWRLRGGSGCTCLDPIAYDLKDHPIFDEPFAIDRSNTIEIDTPSSFQDDLDADSIAVIPIVDDYEKNWRAGWCTYSTAFDVFPDVEFFCGGVNHKTPTAAAIWRQGNLMHFGFQQSPVEMNETGRQVLLNSIAYISNFSEDRPIAITPSVFVEPRARPRGTVAAWLGNPSRSSWVKRMVTEEMWKTIESQGDAQAQMKWAKENTPYITSDPASQLEIDPDLQHQQLGFDDPKFFEAMFKALQSGDGESAGRAERLLRRYVPDGPTSSDVSSWLKWHEANEPFLFATDFGHFRWYVDPLAKQRGVPTSQLRGTQRKDRK